MNYGELTAEKLIERLEMAGEFPEPALIEAVWERREETEPLLLAAFEAAYDDDWADGDDPRWYRFVHAGKFLLSWRSLGALPTFARLYGTSDSAMEDVLEWFEADLFHYGPDAVPYLKEIVAQDMGMGWVYSQAISVSVLQEIAVHYPEMRDEIVGHLRAQLPSMEAVVEGMERNEMWEVFVTALGELGDEESRPLVLALHEADLLGEFAFDMNDYLRDMNKGFRAMEPPPLKDFRPEYREAYESHLSFLRRQERERERAERVRTATPRSGPKVGRNDPCPCGSGRKYKRCHGRSGA